MTIQERVANGAALLDEKKPGWRDKINLEELDISDPSRCVVGQLYQGRGGYLHGLSDLQTYSSYETGFAIENAGEYPLLTAEWKLVLSV